MLLFGTNRQPGVLETLVPVLPRIPLNPKIAVSVVFVAAMFMNIMDITFVNVALPTIGHEFGVKADSLDAVAIGYLVSLAVVIPASGWLGDRAPCRRCLGPDLRRRVGHPPQSGR